MSELSGYYTADDTVYILRGGGRDPFVFGNVTERPGPDARHAQIPQRGDVAETVIPHRVPPEQCEQVRGDPLRIRRYLLQIEQNGIVGDREVPPGQRIAAENDMAPAGQIEIAGQHTVHTQSQQRDMHGFGDFAECFSMRVGSRWRNGDGERGGTGRYSWQIHRDFRRFSVAASGQRRSGDRYLCRLYRTQPTTAPNRGTGSSPARHDDLSPRPAYNSTFPLLSYCAEDTGSWRAAMIDPPQPSDYVPIRPCKVLSGQTRTRPAAATPAICRIRR